MSARRISTGLLAVGLIAAGSMLLGVGASKEEAEVTSKIVVGTFDSRAVTLAAGSTEFLNDRIHAARYAGLQNATPEQIQEWTTDLKKRTARQGFGTGDVSEYLDLIRDEIPGVAREAGVDVIVSKWDVEYQGPEVRFVDVTDALIRLYHPTEERIEIIQDVLAVPPYSERQIRDREMRGD